MVETNMVENILNNIGIYGPIILFILSIILYIHYLTTNNIFLSILFLYIIGAVCCSCINIGLKHIFKYPRPDNPNPALFYSVKRFPIPIHNNGLHLYDYGFPSGHAQSCLYTIVYFLLTLWYYILPPFISKINIPILKWIAWTLLFFIITIITLFQRVISRRHSIIQVICGAIIGVIFGLLYYYFIVIDFKDKQLSKKTVLPQPINQVTQDISNHTNII